MGINKLLLYFLPWTRGQERHGWDLVAHSSQENWLKRAETERTWENHQFLHLPPLPRPPPRPPPRCLPPPNALFASDFAFKFSGRGRMWSTHFLKLKSSEDSSSRMRKKHLLFHIGWYRIWKALIPQPIFFSGSTWPFLIKSSSTIFSYCHRNNYQILVIYGVYASSTCKYFYHESISSTLNWINNKCFISSWRHSGLKMVENFALGTALTEWKTLLKIILGALMVHTSFS